MAGDWGFKKRILLTLEEKEEKKKFSEVEWTVTATKDVFIFESHQKALSIEGNDVQYVNIRLAKDDDAPPIVPSKFDDLSTLTGETRESKAKGYAAAESKKVAT